MSDEDLNDKLKNNKEKIKKDPMSEVFIKQEIKLEPEIAQHIASVHEKNNSLKCSVCYRVFSNSTKLKAHTEAVHEVKITRVHRCRFCRFTTEQGLWTLRAHIKSVHEGKKSFRCSYCVASFSQQSNLTRHIQTNHEPFECSFCFLRFAEKVQLNTHIESVHDSQKQFTAVNKKTENRKEKVCQIIKSGGVIKQIASVHDGQKKTFKVIIKKDPKDGGEIFRQIKSEVFIKQEIELKPETVIKEENIEESFNLPWIKQENISEHNI